MRYRFDHFVLDTERYELRARDEVQHVEPLVFDLLVFFARNAGRIVSRDEIVEGVWQGRAISEATISSCIKAARKALGDTGDSQNYIRTVRARGFEFTREVSSGDEPPAAAAISATRQTAPAAAAYPVVAVLPFVNQSADVEEYFADGLTEDIIANLARFRDLRVISGVSTFHFKGKPINFEELRETLKANYLVQGSVRRGGGRVRISANLIDAATGVQLWGERYDRDMVDILALEEEVTRTLAGTLGVKMQDMALQRALTKRPAELDAYDCILRARRYTRILNAELHAEARELLERAIELDPMSADAHALLANIYLAEHRFDMNPKSNPVGRALVHALAATRLDPENAYARCWLGIVHFFRFENDKFDTEVRLALDLNPSDPETLADAGHYYAFMGEFERGVELSKRARLLNPLHPGWYYFADVRLHYHQKDYEEVLHDVQKIGLPHFYWTHLFAAAAKGQLGHADAAASVERIFGLKPDFSAKAELRKWNAAPDDLEHVLEGLRKAGLRG